MNESLTYHPLVPERWTDLEQLFGKNGAYGGCWCMYWRIRRKEFEKNGGAGNRKALHDLVLEGSVPGILAFENREPVGWCAVAPRSELGSLNRSHVLKRLDDAPVWSITCFFVKKTHRDRGLTDDLIRAAVEYAARHGATVIEAYPHAPVEGRKAPVTAYMGFPDAFRRAGFTLGRKASKARWIMRLET